MGHKFKFNSADVTGWKLLSSHGNTSLSNTEVWVGLQFTCHQYRATEVVL